MAEVIGVASAIAGLITLASQITKLSYSYLCDVKNASKSQKLYLQEVTSLTDLLLRIEPVLESAASAQDLQMRTIDVQISSTIQECQNQLAALKDDLERNLLKNGTFHLLSSDYIWPFKEKDIQKHIEMLHRFRGMLADIVSLDTLSLSAATHIKVDNLRQEHERRQILEWLSHPAAPRSLSAFQDAACPETGGWFLNSDAYLQWSQDPSGLLWCHGKPGAGKTMLSAMVLENLVNKHSVDTNVSVLHHFCDFTERSQQTTTAILQMLIRQILLQGDKRHIACLQKSRETSSKPPRCKDLSNALINACSLYKTNYFVLDALDEFEDRRNLYPLLCSMIDAGWHVFVTSRDLPDIRDTFQHDRNVEFAANGEDLRLYVNQRLQGSDFSDISGSRSIADTVVARAGGIFLLARLLMDQLLDLTTVKQMRRFLVSMPASVQEGYAATVERILAQPRNRSALAMRVIGWVTFSRRRLQMDELLHAFAVEDDSDVLDEENLISPKLILQVCIGLVMKSPEDSTLELIHATAYDFFRNLTDQFALIHADIGKTSLIYLCLRTLKLPCQDAKTLSARLQEMPFLAYASQHWGSHAQRMESEVQAWVNRLLEDPGLRASAFQTLQYRRWRDPDLAALSFASLPSGQVALHIAAYWNLALTMESLLSSGIDPSPRDAQGWTPLHWACANGHEPVTALLLKQGVDVDIQDSIGWTPLFWACFRGNPSIVKMLFAHLANHRIRDNHGWTALHWSVTSRQNDIVIALLAYHAEYLSKERRIEIPIKSISLDRARQLRNADGKSDSPSPVQIASENGDFSIFETLMEDLSTRNRKQETPEQQFNVLWSQTMFDPPMSNVWRVMSKVEHFHGREYYLRDTETPIGSDWKSRFLHVAIKDQKLSMVHMILELGVDANARIEDRTPLHTAAFRTDPRYAEALLQHGADPRLTDWAGLTALHQAILNGFEATAVILIENGACVNTRTDPEAGKYTSRRVKGPGGTPLIIACGAIPNKKDPDLPKRLVQRLLNEGAEVSATNLRGQTALHAAVQCSSVAVIELLLEAGADIAALDKDGKTVFHYFVERRDSSKEIIDILLAKMSATEAKRISQYSCCPLSMALKDSQWDTFPVLLAAGFALWTPIPRPPDILWQAIWQGQSDIVHFVLDQHNFDASQFGSPPWKSLMWMSGLKTVNTSPQRKDIIESFTSISRCLAKAGLMEEKDATSALRYAAQNVDSAEIAQLLVDYGADMYEKEDKFDTFALAAIYGHSETLRCLLANRANRSYTDLHAQHWLGCFERLRPKFSNDAETIFASMKEAGILDLRSNDGHTPLEIALHRGDSNTALQLLAQGVDIENADEYGWRPLHTAIYEGHESIVDLLLEAGADASASTLMWAHDGKKPSGLYQRSKWSGQPLHLAAMFGYRHVVEKLLKRGADVKARTSEKADSFPGHGPTALHIALDTGTFYSMVGEHLDHNRLSIAQLLIDNGADVADVAAHLRLDDVLRFEEFEGLWDVLRGGISSEGVKVTVSTFA